MSRVLVAMSGGVDSSVAAALLAAQGHEVVGVTMKLWGGESDTGCCSVSDVDDARRVAQQLDIDHLVFNLGNDFAAGVVDHYIDAHRRGRTPNPCIECNRSIKFDRLLRRAHQLGFDHVATGHHARVTEWNGSRFLRRGADRAKDQSYVLYMLGQDELSRVRFPVGDLTKAQVRSQAARLGLRTAAKPDSQDVCFISSTAGRAGFLSGRTPMTPGRIVDSAGTQVGSVPAVEMVTVGQRRGLALGGAPGPRYAVDVDVATATVTIGSRADLDVTVQAFEQAAWAMEPAAGPVLVQTSAHGEARPGLVDGDRVVWDHPQRRVAPGQSIVFYVPDSGEVVLGGAIAV